jgi:hypothetical protein
MKEVSICKAVMMYYLWAPKRESGVVLVLLVCARRNKHEVGKSAVEYGTERG